MLVHPHFNPIAIDLGQWHLFGATIHPAVHWYGLMYLLAFVLFLILGRYRASQNWRVGWHPRQIEDLLFYGVVGVIVGGRLGYVLFYKFGDYLAQPLHIFYVWEGGMSFHGGFIGVLIAMLLFARHTQKHWLDVTDFIAPLVPLGLACGRIGNFINGELWGRPTDVPWAMVFPSVDQLPRHPSQLYEFALEGIALFLILWFFSSKPKPRGAVSALFLVGYGTFRFGVEFTRQPDDFLGLLTLGLSMGQWLSLPMILIGGAWLIWIYRNPNAGLRK